MKYWGCGVASPQWCILDVDGAWRLVPRNGSLLPPIKMAEFDSRIAANEALLALFERPRFDSSHKIYVWPVGKIDQKLVELELVYGSC